MTIKWKIRSIFNKLFSIYLPWLLYFWFFKFLPIISSFRCRLSTWPLASPIGKVTLVAITGSTILVPWHVVKSQQPILRSGTRWWKSTWAQSLNGLAQSLNGLQWLELKTGHHDSSPINSHQGDMLHYIDNLKISPDLLMSLNHLLIILHGRGLGHWKLFLIVAEKKKKIQYLIKKHSKIGNNDVIWVVCIRVNRWGLWIEASFSERVEKHTEFNKHILVLEHILP